ncbi:MAG: DGQHR domain-containing protein [Acidobacteria bacterium]|nr:DGQHR domain-containing protein [Acidobacteriota bacterium]
MTQIYPAIRAQMGRWDYYMVRMSMRELAENVKFANEIHAPTELDQAIQRSLNESRAKRQIAAYLANHDDRFFNSLVVAALEGDPQWYPVSIEELPEFKILSGDKRLAEAFGVLTFNGEQRYYALDGQHRLAGIRSLMNGEADLSLPNGFQHEEMSVIIVMPTHMESHGEFMVRYRRLFGHLNRYAKSMSKFDTIVMDEDDVIAIITRRLVSEHSFFRSGIDQFASHRVKMDTGKNLRSGSEHWTSLETLYELNGRLLQTSERRNRGWGQREVELKKYILYRPEDEEIDALADELFCCWDGIVGALPMLNEDPLIMRDHNPEDGSDHQDNVLFWPIVQELLVDVARHLLDDEIARRNLSADDLSSEDAVRILEPLDRIVWDAHCAPWRHLMLVPDETGRWKIANEDRKPRMRIAERIIRWQLGLDDLSHDSVWGENGLRASWRHYVQMADDDEADSMWNRIEAGIVV